MFPKAQRPCLYTGLAGDVAGKKTFIEIEGHKHFIKAAWIEHPHNETNWGDVVGDKIYCFVMELEYNPDLNIDLKEYIDELGNGPTLVWFFLTNGDEKSDYIKLQYRYSIHQPNKDRAFLLYRK